MNRFLQQKPLHAFLIGFYFISVIFVQNLAKVSFPMIYRSIIISLLVSALLFGINYFFFRSNRKAGIFTTLLLVGFFTYGIVYNRLELLAYSKQWPFAHIHRYLILGYLVIYLVLFFIFLRSSRPHHNVNFALNVFVLSVLLFNMVLGISYGSRRAKQPAQASTRTGSDNIAFATTARPDIYYIILDGFASEASLKKFYGVKQAGLYSYLRKKGFYVADSSYTNYPFTDMSLTSSLNMQYLNSADSNAHPTINQNRLSVLLKNNGYRLVNIETGFAVTEHLVGYDRTISIGSMNEFESRMLELTVLRLDDVLGFSNYKRLKNQLRSLDEFHAEPGPKFGFIHIVSPHPPFVMDSTGNQMIRNTLSDVAWEPRANYLSQLEYISRRTAAFIDSVISRSKQPPVIILQSDHGPWVNDREPKHVYDARASILNAYYVPDSCRKDLYPSITPVNSFRFVFNRIFNTSFPQLPDQAYPYDSLLLHPTFRLYTRK